MHPLCQGASPRFRALLGGRTEAFCPTGHNATPGADALHPIGHVGEPSDVANGIVYLASEEARFVTGSALVIDGGYTAQ